MSRIPVVYIAGPFRAPNAWQREKNIREAEELAFRVAECGAMPLCPHTNTRHFDGTLDDAFWLAGTLALLSKCDAAVFTKRWEESSGAKAEMIFAVDHGIQVFKEEALPLGRFAFWLEKWKATP
jgi:hypothetical protein